MGQEKLNAQTIEFELQWLQEVIKYRFSVYFHETDKQDSIVQINPPVLDSDSSIYADFVKSNNLDQSSRLALILALAPHVRPQCLDSFFVKNSDFDRGFTEFGGLKGHSHGGFIPTGETYIFLYAGMNISLRLEAQKVFDINHPFNKHKVLSIGESKDYEPYLSGSLNLNSDFIDVFTIGEAKKPTFSSSFPASLVETDITWDDLVLDNKSRDAVNHMLGWIQHNHVILNDWGMKSKIKPGYRALFHGPPGTGKTLTASLMGKSTGKDVYKIDISMISSKWIGETEKNLAKIFDTAETKDWILFFDEADSIFGKRTSKGGSNEKQSNQEISYLLQRTEEYPGIVILASNLLGNIDDAFIRRFQSMIQFKIPTWTERLKLWEKAFNSTISIESDIDIKEISKKFEIAGGAIVNVLKFCSIKAAQRNSKVILKHELLEGIKYELLKEGKV